MMRGVVSFLYLCEHSAKRDITADLSYYITTGGVALQLFEFIKVCIGKNGNRHLS